MSVWIGEEVQEVLWELMKKTEQKRAALIAKIEAEHLSVEQAAEALGIPRPTAFRIMRGVEVEGVQRGRHPKPSPVTIPAPVIEPKPEPVIVRTPGVDPYAELFKDME